MAYRVFRHPDVEHDMRAIEILLLDYAGPAIALRKIEEIEAALFRLADNPRIGSLRNEIFPGLRAIPCARKAVIAFVVDERLNAVFVVSVTYAGADWQAKIPKRTGQ